MIFPIYQIVFYFYAALLLFSAVMVVISQNPVRSILFLVLAFFASAVLWMLVEAEFLALVLIFVYVGAVMTLFLFVVMMLPSPDVPTQIGPARYIPFGILLLVLLAASMLFVIGAKHYTLPTSMPIVHDANYSNVKQVGTLLYTHYLYPFEIAGAILFVAIIAAISLAFHGTKPNTKKQRIQSQLAARKQDRLRIINMRAEPK